jgi:hypothetical protein
VVLIAIAPLLSSPVQAADAILVLGKRPAVEGTTGGGAKAAAEPPAIPLTFGEEQSGRVPVTIPAGSFVLPLIDTEQAPSWLRKGPAILRLSAPALGYVASDGTKSALSLAGRITVEDAEGQVLGEYTVEVNSDLPEGYAAGDELRFSVVAKPADPDSAAPPLFSSVVFGRLEEVP